MSLTLTRRRFGQLAIGSTAVAAIGYLANKTFAQTTDPLLYGLRVEFGGKLAVETLNPVSGDVQDVSENLTSDITLDTGDQVTGFTSLSDGTLVACVTPASDKGQKKQKDPKPPYLRYLGASSKTVEISGLKDKKETIVDIVGTEDGKLLGLVAKRNGRPPNKIVSIGSDGKISKEDTVPGRQRVTNLAESADKTIYTATVDDDGKPTVDEKKLNSDKKNLNNGLNSLVGDSSDKSRFYVLASARYETTRSVFSVDITSDEDAKLLKEGWEVNKMTKRLKV
jgi:hypothetical protein